MPELTNVDDRGKYLRGKRDERIRDAQQERQKHEEQWEINTKLYHGDHEALFSGHNNSNRRYFTSNHIQGAVITQVAVMTEQPIRPTFTPRETNEPPEIFLKPESAFKAQGMGLSEDQLQGQELIPEQLFDFISAQTRTETVDNPEAGQTIGTGENAQPQPGTIEVEVPIFEDEDFIFVDDALCAEALTQEHNSEWEMCDGDSTMRQGITQASVIGHQDMIVQWNDQDNRFNLVLLYPYHSWIHRWAYNPGDASSYDIKRIIPVAEAKRQFPGFDEVIEKNKTTTSDNGWWGGIGGGKFSSTGSGEDFVEVDVGWVRDEPFPMEPEEAMEKGLIEVATEEPLVDPDTGEIADMGGQPIVDEEGQTQWITADGEATAPGEDNWPVRFGIRQEILIGDTVVYEGETEFSDIPVARVKNIPIVQSSYGQGEPERLASLQELKNRLWTIYHNYCLRYQSPEQVMPSSVLNELEAEVSTLHSEAGRKIGVPDNLLRQLGGIQGIVYTIPIPQLTDVFFNLLTLVTEEMNNISGIVDVLRGEAKSEWSGELFQQATNAARGPIGYKARGVSEAIKHIAGVTANLIIDFLPAEEWEKRNKKYPRQVLEVMRRRLKRVGFDVAVEVGGASTRESKAQRMSLALQNTPILVQSETFMKQYTEHMGLKDGDKIVRELQQAAMPA